MKDRTFDRLRSMAELVADAEADALKTRRALHRVMREVYDRGVSATEIAEAVGMSRPSVHRVVGPQPDDGV